VAFGADPFSLDISSPLSLFDLKLYSLRRIGVAKVFSVNRNRRVAYVLTCFIKSISSHVISEHTQMVRIASINKVESYAKIYALIVSKKTPQDSCGLLGYLFRDSL